MSAEFSGSCCGSAGCWWSSSSVGFSSEFSLLVLRSGCSGVSDTVVLGLETDPVVGIFVLTGIGVTERSCTGTSSTAFGLGACCDNGCC